MTKTTILFQGITPDQLIQNITLIVQNQLNQFGEKILSKKADDELLTRKEACEFLSIDSSTLWAWTNSGKVKAYGIANRRYYKRSELIDCLIPVN